ncbi:MAG: hypothetical protein J7527_00620 [Chitinophagaceae bacterium]|nr:hypothetical protein [Chitinophagaceae bacterium]
MDTVNPGSHAKPVLTQAENNTTLWIGHLQTDPTDHFGGQTFTCPDQGQLDNIQLFASAVQYPGNIQLSLHEFDPVNKTWGPSLGQCVTSVKKEDTHSWIRFALPTLELKKLTTYAFRVTAKDALVGFGEAACDNLHPFTFGHEWNGDSTDQKGHFYSYFSLAFKVEMRA